MITRTSHPVHEPARGPVEQRIETVLVEDLMGTHLDYALALLMPFKIVVLEHIAGLRPAWVTVETENEKRSWSPSSSEEHAKEFLSHLDLPLDQGCSRELLENALKSQAGSAVNIPILTSPDVASPYSAGTES